MARLPCGYEVSAARSALRINASEVKRSLDQFPAAFAGPQPFDHQGPLSNVIAALPRGATFACQFAGSYCGTVKPEPMLVFERLLRTMAALRMALRELQPPQIEIEPCDYSAARSVLLSLPMVPAERLPSPDAVELAACLYAQLRKQPGIELPDLSDAGATWFTRKQVQLWVDRGYNTAKKYLAELEANGILQSTVAENNRRRGKQQHYRFVDGIKPPFVSKHPFGRLPELADVPPLNNGATLGIANSLRKSHIHK